VTTEDDFNAALDANPDDHQTRLVFADWLQERGDERAEGYRALGMRRLSTRKALRARWYDAAKYGEASGENLPSDWYAALITHLGSDRDTVRLGCLHRGRCWSEFLTRREAEDAAALAFEQLPAERRAELLAAPDRSE
jgi:uncharacterized protein (TIGR02996 family)